MVSPAILRRESQPEWAQAMEGKGLEAPAFDPVQMISGLIGNQILKSLTSQAGRTAVEEAPQAFSQADMLLSRLRANQPKIKENMDLESMLKRFGQAPNIVEYSEQATTPSRFLSEFPKEYLPDVKSIRNWNYYDRPPYSKVGLPVGMTDALGGYWSNAIKAMHPQISDRQAHELMMESFLSKMSDPSWSPKSSIEPILKAMRN